MSTDNNSEIAGCAICGVSMDNILDRHNAMPIADGWCCTVCNDVRVIPQRVKEFLEHSKSVPDEGVDNG